jgi:hypothetical protein
MAATDDARNAVLLMRWEGGGGTALDRDAYLRNVAAGSSSGWTWGQVEQDAESVSFRFDRKSLKRPAGPGIVILVWNPDLERASENDQPALTPVATS